MKKILIILALAGFTAASGYAQNTNCVCKKKAYHKVASTHHHWAHHAKMVAAKTEESTNCNLDAAIEPCYMYKKDNILVMECPGVFYDKDNKGVFEYSKAGAYLGHYPLKENNATNSNGCTDVNTNLNKQIAPQHTTIDSYRGVAPEGGNYCANCTPQ